jgi:hypothetical protein
MAFPADAITVPADDGDRAELRAWDNARERCSMSGK